MRAFRRSQLVLWSLVFLSSTGSAQPGNLSSGDCVRYDRCMHIESALGIKAPLSVSLLGPIACVGTRDSLFVVDAANTRFPDVRARVQIPASQISWRGSGQLIALAANGVSRLVDVTDPSHPFVVGTISQRLPGRVFVQGNYVAAVQGAAFQIFDISVPEQTLEVGSLQLPSAATNAAVGRFVYASCTGQGLQILNWDDPVHPYVAGSLMTTAGVGAGKEGMVYLTESISPLISRLDIVDASDPTQPYVVGSTEFAGGVGPIVLSGPWALVRRQQSVRVLEVTEATTPRDAGTMLNLGNIGGLDADNTLAAVTSAAGVSFLDTSHPVPPEPMLSSTFVLAAHALTVNGTTAVVVESACSQYGCVYGRRLSVGTYSIANPIYPSATNHCLPSVSVPLGANVFVNGLVIAGGSSWLCPGWIIGIGAADAVPARTFIAGAANTVFRIFWGDVPITGDVVDLPVPGVAQGVAADGDVAFVACGSAGLTIVDTANDRLPSIITVFALPFAAVRVALVGSTLYVTDSEPGLQIIDASDVHSPRLLGRCWIPSPGRLKVSGSTAYIACPGSGVAVVDVADPQSPRMIQNLGTDARDVGISGGIVVSIGAQSLDVFSGRCDPTTPVAVWDFSAVSTTGAIQLHWRAQEPCAILRTTGDQLGLGWTTLGSPAHVGSDEWTYADSSVEAGVSYSYWLASGRGDERTVIAGPVTATATTVGLAIRQTIPRGAKGIELRLQVGRTESVEMDCFDIRGRRVRHWPARVYQGGAHVLSWDGQDDDGTAIASGVYMVRVRTATAQAVCRIVRTPY